MLITNCGVVIDGTTLKTINGVLTLDTNDTVTNIKNHPICGGCNMMVTHLKWSEKY